MTSAQPDARTVEEASLRAWPPIEEERLGGWTLRYSEGYSKRANSVQALGESGLEMDESVRRCEAWYAERGRPCIFRVTPFTQPRLDDGLERRGYDVIERTHVLSRDAEGLTGLTEVAGAAQASERIQLAPAELHDWLREYARLSGSPAAPGPLGRIIASIGPRSFLGVLRRGSSRRVVACGLAVFDGALLGLFDLIVDRDERRRGLGRVLVRELARWGVEHGALLVYLQVTHDNAPALGLYERLGFEPLYDYRYRISPS